MTLQAFLKDNDRYTQEEYGGVIILKDSYIDQSCLGCLGCHLCEADSQDEDSHSRHRNSSDLSRKSKESLQTNVNDDSMYEHRTASQPLSFTTRKPDVKALTGGDDTDSTTDFPSEFKSDREKRLYLGRGTHVL